MTVRIGGSHPDYPAIELALHLLGVLINPSCWFGIDPMPEFERTVNRTDLENEIQEFFDGIMPDAFREWFDA